MEAQDQASSNHLGARKPSIEASLVGTRVHAVAEADLRDAIQRAVSTRSRLMVGHQNLHGLALLQRDPELRRYYEQCDLVYADGLPVVLMARALGFPFRREHRITSLDFIDSILADATRDGWKVYYLGSAPGVIDIAAAEFRARHPGLRLAIRHGHFDMTPGSDDSQEVLESVEAFAPQILIVGMGMPRQERWLLVNRGRLTASVLLPIGALADYVAGAIPTPPRWAGRVGLEWLFRLAAEPRRLAKRYLVEPWSLLLPFLRDLRARHSRGRQG